MLKKNALEMEWAWMQGYLQIGRRIFQICKAYRKPLLLGLFLGISLSIGTILVSQVVGKEQKSVLLPNDRAGDEASQIITKEVQKATSNQTKPEEQVSKPPTESAVKSSSQSANEPSNDPVSALKGSRFTVLLVGVDRRPKETTLSNTDTLLVVSINTENGKIALLSVPRDTQVIIPGYGMDKINSAARVGKGLKTTTSLIEDLIGQPIDGYVLTNFSGFKSIIDTLGGITITVEKDMYYVTGDAVDGVINLKKGTQRLNGTQALQYARFRHDAFADISRTARQQAVLKAIEKELIQITTVPKLPWLIPQMSKSVETNLSIGELWSLMNVLLRHEKPEISSQTLPGNFLTQNGVSYWKVDGQQSRDLVKKLFEEGKTTSVFFR